jgi:hypothetical protein
MSGSKRREIRLNSEFTPIPGLTVIGFGHKARHGKDTACAAILKVIPNSVRVSFADDLYAYCRVMHGMTVKDAPLLQRVGVQMREADPCVWIRCAYSKMLQAAADGATLVVIPDVRFKNELAFVRDLGGYAVKVTRLHPVTREAFVDPSRPADHPSETDLDNVWWDETITSTSVAYTQKRAVALAQSVHGLVGINNDGLSPDDRYNS